MWNPLTSMTKTAIALTIGGGILISGIAWQGDEAVQVVKNSVDSLQSKLITAIGDNEFLQSQFSGLKDAYTRATSEANATIQQLKAQRLDLMTQLANLNSQIEADNMKDQEEKATIQAEINRLEGELDKANQAIHELESYAVNKDQATPYTATNRDNFQFSEVTMEKERSWTVAPNVTSAVNYSQTNMDVMTNETNLVTMEQNYRDTQQKNIKFVGITTWTHTDGRTYLAYIIQPDNANLTQFNSAVNNIVKSMDMNTDMVFFVNESGQLVGTQFEQ